MPVSMHIRLVFLMDPSIGDLLQLLTATKKGDCHTKGTSPDLEQVMECNGAFHTLVSSFCNGYKLQHISKTEAPGSSTQHFQF